MKSNKVKCACCGGAIIPGHGEKIFACDDGVESVQWVHSRTIECDVVILANINEGDVYEDDRLINASEAAQY